MEHAFSLVKKYEVDPLHDQAFSVIKKHGAPQCMDCAFPLVTFRVSSCCAQAMPVQSGAVILTVCSPMLLDAITPTVQRLDPEPAWVAQKRWVDLRRCTNNLALPSEPGRTAAVLPRLPHTSSGPIRQNAHMFPYRVQEGTGAREQAKRSFRSFRSFCSAFASCPGLESRSKGSSPTGDITRI